MFKMLRTQDQVETRTLGDSDQVKSKTGMYRVHLLDLEPHFDKNQSIKLF